MDAEENRWNAAHHPFTSVHDGDIEKLTAIRRAAVPSHTTSSSTEPSLDWVLFVSIYATAGQSFLSAGFSDEEANPASRLPASKLSNRRAAPGGIGSRPGSPGHDPGGETSIREVIPFPKTARGTDLMCDAAVPRA